MLPCFGNVYWNPSVLRLEELSPAVVSRDLGRVFVRRKRKSYFKSRRNSLRTRHGDKQGMKVGAVAFFGVAGVEHIAASPAGARFVVTHGRKYVIVDGACLFERRGLALGDLHG